MVIPSKGRETLSRTLASVAPQLSHGDELVVLRLDCTYGNEARDRIIGKASGTHLVFIDDDDVLVDDALNTIRQAIGENPDRVLVFQMRYQNGTVLWGEPVIAPSNVGTPMWVVPTDGPISRWAHEDGTENVAESDYHFIRRTMLLRGDDPVFIPTVIAEIRP